MTYYWIWIKSDTTTGATCGAEPAYPVAEPEFTPGANNVTDCFSEYLSTFGFESVIKFIVYEVKFDPTKGVIRNCKSKDH
jgi:hypothetical protein